MVLLGGAHHKVAKVVADTARGRVFSKVSICIDDEIWEKD